MRTPRPREKHPDRGGTNLGRGKVRAHVPGGVSPNGPEPVLSYGDDVRPRDFQGSEVTPGPELLIQDRSAPPTLATGPGCGQGIRGSQ